MEVSEPITQGQDQPGGVFNRPSLSEVKARRGRKTNAEIIAEHEAAKASPGPSGSPGAPCAIVLQPRHVEGLTGLPFMFTAGLLKDPKWLLDKDDKEFLSMPLSDALNEILPDLARKYPRWAILSVAFGSVAAKKSMEPSKRITVPVKTTNKEPVASANPEPEISNGLTSIEKKLKDRASGGL